MIFLGHRKDIREILAVSDVSLSLTEKPEAFGRVIVESLSLGTPVVAYDHGGAAEQLEIMLPSGRVPVGDLERATQTVADFLRTPQPSPPSTLSLCTKCSGPPWRSTRSFFLRRSRRNSGITLT